MAFCSSRTLPGQECSTSAWRAASLRLQVLAPHLARVALEEGVGQDQDVAAPAAQRRDLDRAAPRAGSRGPRGTPCAPPPALQVAVGRRHHPHVHADRLHAADPLELLLLHQPQDLAPAATSGMSPISSRNSVPWWAISTLPTLRPVAPVKAPFSWPNSSFSSSVSGMAAQLMATNGPLARVRELVQRRAPSAPCRCRSRRGRSTVASVGAARWMASIVSFSAGSSPRTRGRPKRRWYSSFSSTYSVIRRRWSMARLDQEQQVIGVHGLGEELGGAVLHRAAPPPRRCRRRS